MTERAGSVGVPRSRRSAAHAVLAGLLAAAGVLLGISAEDLTQPTHGAVTGQQVHRRG